MDYERVEKNPGSSEDFARAVKPFLQSHGELFAQNMRIKPVFDIAAPATAEVIERTNAQPPTPEI